MANTVQVKRKSMPLLKCMGYLLPLFVHKYQIPVRWGVLLVYAAFNRKKMLATERFLGMVPNLEYWWPLCSPEALAILGFMTQKLHPLLLLCLSFAKEKQDMEDRSGRWYVSRIFCCFCCFLSLFSFVFLLCFAFLSYPGVFMNYSWLSAWDCSKLFSGNHPEIMMELGSPESKTSI